MYKKLLKYIGVMAIAGTFAGAPFVYAQVTSGVVPAPIQYVVSPDTPGPNTQVTIVVQGVGTFLGDSTITWSQDGKVVASGVGLRNFTFTTGTLGTHTNIHVKIVSGSQGTLTQDWVFSPSAVSLIWEADTSVPPLYRGKALYSGGSNLTVVAFPSIVINGKSIAGQYLSYQWSVNDNPLPQQSGLGQSVLRFTGDQLQNQEDVSVTVLYNGNNVGSGDVIIPTTAPEVLWYDFDALRGLQLDVALPNAVSLTSKEITLQAVPYYFANSSLKSGSAGYAWTLNGDSTTGPNANKGMLTLRQTGTGAGAASIGVAVQNTDTDKLVQATEAAIQIVFGQSSGSSLFGL